MGGSFNQDYRSAQVQDGWPSILYFHDMVRTASAEQYTFHDTARTSKSYAVYIPRHGLDFKGLYFEPSVQSLKRLKT